MNNSVFARTSHINISGSHSASLPFMSPVLSQAANTGELQTQLFTSISQEVHELKEISRYLKEQFLAIDSKIDVLLKREEQRLSSMSSMNSFVTRSEVSVDTPSLSPGPKSYSEVANSNINNHEANNKSKSAEILTISDNKTPKKNASATSQSQNGNIKNKVQGSTPRNKSTPQNDTCENTTRRPSTNQRRNSPRTLLIGDSIISGVNKKGLIRNMECLSIPGGTIYSLTNKLEIFDISKFSNIIITIGGNDAADKANLDSFYVDFNNLIKSTKLINPQLKIFLCSSSPRGDTDVTDINNVILQLCQENNLSFIDINASFYDQKKNELKYHFYKPRDSIHLSRSGTKRLLGSINEHITVVDNFEKCVFSSNMPQQLPQTNNINGKQPYYSQPKQWTTGTFHTHSQRGSTAYLSSDRQDRNLRNHTRHHVEPAEPKRTERCMKCGMTNHATLDCFHQKQVQCFKCRCFGHKDYMGLCWNK